MMRRLLVWLEAGLLALAAATLGYSVYIWVSTRAFQARAVRELQKQSSIHRAPPATAPVEGALLGQIEIPRVGVAAVILEGTAANTLQRAVGHIAGTALPGQAGNIALAGHRDTFFRPLRRIIRGDEALVTTPTRSSVYRVEETRILDPTDVEVLRPTGADTLTLITCYPFYFVGSAPKRFLVRAVRISTGPS